MTEEEDSIDLIHYYRILRPWLWLMVLCLSLGGGVGYLVSKVQPNMYEASTTLMVDIVGASGSPEYSNMLASQLVAKNFSKLITSRLVLAEVTKYVEGDRSTEGLTPERLEKMITVVLPASAQIVVIRVRNQDPELAARIANSVGGQVLTLGGSAQSQYVRIVDRAEVPVSPISRDTTTIVLIAGLVGLSLSVVIIYIAETKRAPRLQEAANSPFPSEHSTARTR